MTQMRNVTRHDRSSRDRTAQSASDRSAPANAAGAVLRLVERLVGVRLRERYGSPPYLFPELCLKVLCVTFLIALAGLAIAVAIHGSIEMRDVIGTMICVPISAYLVHLWMLPLQ